MSYELINEIARVFGEKVEIFVKTKKRYYVSAKHKDDALELVRFLFRDKALRFSTASGVDFRDGIEILYHMADDKNGVRITVRALAEKPNPSMASASGFMPAAEWIEREMHELLGVDFPGHPGLTKLLLPDDWPKGVYPLRKGQ